MTRAKEAPAAESLPSEELLWKALRADSPKRRLRYAEAGLEGETGELAPDTRVLLLRQAYRAHVDLRELRSALAIAREMASIGPLRDIAHHDASRVLQALGETDEAIAEQRMAARHAPAERRSFQLWALATVQHFAGAHEAAESNLRRALRWANRGRALIRAHAAYVKLERGAAVRDLQGILTELGDSRSREGYGRFLLGMIAYHMGDWRQASVHLRAFLNRHAAAEEAQALTLREELRRARMALARFESA